MVENSITKEDTDFHKAISAGERPAVTLRFLTSGESQQSLSFAYLVWKSNLSRNIRETCDVIFEALAGEYLHPPLSGGEKENIARDYRLRLQHGVNSMSITWNLPHVVGAIGGKHIIIQCPKQSETLFHNYKKLFSFVLIAICDARCCLTLFAVGQYGSNNDAGVLANSSVA